MKSKPHKITQVQILIAGVLTAVKGFDSLSTSWFAGLLTMVLGIFLVGFFIYEARHKKRQPVMEAVALMVEGAALACTAYLYFITGKVYLPYAILLASLASFAGAAVILYKGKVKPATDL